MARTLIIGDIHGCWQELQDLLDAAAITDDDLVISVGDLIDRGPDPASVVAFFRARTNAVALMGNHERKHVRGVFSYSQEVARLQLGEDYAEAVAWMAGLPYHYEDEQVAVVHWGHFPGTPLHGVPEVVRAGTTAGEKLLRERYGEVPWWEHYASDKPIAFGHHVVGPEPLVVDGRIFGLDTGACHGLTLTGLLLPERRLISVPAREDHWARVRREWQDAVLRAWPWPEWTWDQVARKLGRASGPPGSARHQVRVWAEEVRSAIPSLARALDAEVEALLRREGEEGFGRAGAAHPASRWLLAHHRGKLSRSSLACERPADVFALADALGVALTVPRRP